MSDIVILSKYEESTKNARKFWFFLSISELPFIAPTVSKLKIAQHQKIQMLHLEMQPYSSVNIRYKLPVQTYGTSYRYKHTVQVTGANTQYKLPVQFTGTKIWCKLPVQTYGTSYRYKHTVQITGTSYRYKNMVQIAGTNIRYKLPVQTNYRYKQIHLRP